MNSIYSYLTFNGNCREAMNFYKDCLGGELTLQTIRESPLSGKMPSEMKKSILHSTLTKDNFVLMGSDMVGDNGLIKGNSVSLMLNCSSEEEVRAFYTSLSKDGEATHPLEDSFRGALIGDLTDKYGNHWLLHFDKTKKSNSMEKSNDLPVKLAAPARRALENAGITRLEQLSKYTEIEIAGLHGIGQNAIKAIKLAFLKKGMSFSKEKTQKNI